MVSVSVIVPVYNRKRFCQNAVRLLQEQTLRDIQFIIIDDGSTDGTYEYIKDIVANDERFILLKLSRNSGPSVARNKGLQVATGKYVGFFDIDDTISPDYFESLYAQACTADNPDIVYCSYNGLKHSKDGIITVFTDKISCLRNGAVWDKIFSNKLIKEKNILFPEGMYCADNVFAFESFFYAKDILLINYPVYQYKLSSDSISINKAKAKKRKKDILKVVDILIQFMQGSKLNGNEILEAVYFMNRSFNNYSKDRKFRKAFNSKISTISRSSVGLSSFSIRRRKMLLLKLRRHLGLISRKRYDELVLRKQVLSSGLFDRKWYLEHYPDVADANIDPVKHYLDHGWKEGRNPSPKFNNNGYLQDYPDIAAANMCPLVHYINHGYKEGRYVRSLTGNVVDFSLKEHRTILENIRYCCKYPLRVREEYEHIKSEIKEIQRNI